MQIIEEQIKFFLRNFKNLKHSYLGRKGNSSLIVLIVDLIRGRKTQVSIEEFIRILLAIPNESTFPISVPQLIVLEEAILSSLECVYEMSEDAFDEYTNALDWILEFDTDATDAVFYVPIDNDLYHILEVDFIWH